MFNVHGKQVTWACECPRPDTFWFGTEGGTISYRDLADRELGYDHIFASKQSINGIAFTDDMVAVSTRSELYIRSYFKEDPIAQETTYLPGTHGVISNGTKGFIAPLGPLGVMTVTRVPNGQIHKLGCRRLEADLYFYKMAYLDSTPTGDSIVA